MPWSCNMIHLYAISCGKEIQGYLNVLVINSIPHPGVQLYYRLLQMPQQSLCTLTWCSASLFWNGSKNNIFSLVDIICFTFWHILTNVSLGTVGAVTAHPTFAALWMQSEALTLVACEPWEERWQKRRYLPRSGTQSVPGMRKEEIREKKGTGFTLSVN